jgi:hypothetical protein
VNLIVKHLLQSNLKSHKPLVPLLSPQRIIAPRRYLKEKSLCQTFPLTRLVVAQNFPIQPSRPYPSQSSITISKVLLVLMAELSEYELKVINDNPINNSLDDFCNTFK